MAHHHHSCEDEHHDHVPPARTNAQQSLYQWIDVPSMRCLNVVAKGDSSTAAAGIIKSNDERYDISRYIESDADCQMLLHIPFTTSCRLYSIILRGAKGGEPGLGCMRHVKIYSNLNKNLDFDTVSELKPSNVLEYPQNVGVYLGGSQTEERGEHSFVEHHLPRHQFQNCHSLTLFVEDTWSGDEDDLTQLCYLELRGESTGLKPDSGTALLRTVYEAAPNPSDHVKLESEHEKFHLGM
ncbi:AaceriAGR016Wp [[Ashbya] aceris (nom. inval.)]|nr:AaceriAGR016Wp [[Ashbya] aceris (nom. inval.)]